MTRNFPVPKLNSQRRSSSFAKLLAAAVISSSVGLSVSPQAAAQSRNQSGEIRQVAGGGLFGGLFGGGGTDAGGQIKEPYRKATAVPSDREVNWNGIPFHNPTDGRPTSNPQTPIHDPGTANRAATAARPSRPTSNTAAAPRSSVPTPSPVAASTPRKLTTASESGATAHMSSGGRPEPLSVTQSSRRPPSLERRGVTVQLDSTRPTPVAKPQASAVAVDVKPVELVPRVSRKVIKSAPTAVTAKLADTPADDAVAADMSVTPSNGPEPVAAPQDAPEQNRSSAIAATSPTATLGTPMPTDATDDYQTPAAEVSGMALSGNNQPSGSLTAANDGVALHPISDRLPIEDTDDNDKNAPIQSDSQFAAQGDAFGPRAHTASGTTMPNYHSTGFGHNEIGGMPAEIEDAAPEASELADAPATGATGLSNTMRSTVPAPVPSGAGVPTPAVSVAANSNTFSTELPVIRVTTAGPRQVTIRQTHTYEIRVENRGSINAEGLVVRAHIPDWADVVSQQSSRGDVAAATEDQVRNLNWRIERLDAGQSETLNVRLKAARSGTHDLDVDWTLAPQKRVVQVTVQEPQLELTIDGPDEVVFGESKTYQIRVLNSGDGIAPEVIFTLSPDSSSPQSQRIGDIPAGKEAQFEVELTAQDLGELKIHGLAVGDLELKAEADKTVRVLAADLEAILTGPEVKYQDTEAVYQLELTNQGSATSENVVATMQLPVGVTYQGGLEGATMIDSQLRWKIASLTPGAVRKYQFQCRMDSTGDHQFAFECKGTAAGQTNVSLDTSVEAIADLVLSIVDPAAPAPVGEDVTYEIVIHNRGSKPALDVQAIAQFSTGIEPKQITGHAGEVVTGQVLVEPIPRIEGGQEVRMTIIASAQTGGHHRFRTEVRSGDTVLVAEEATHFLAPKTQRITRRSGAQTDEVAQPVR